MYNQQNFHTSAYRGNVQGHDSYLRSDSQNASFGASQSVTSQYRGLQKQFQPTGQVASVYGQQQTAGFAKVPSQSWAQSATNTNAFHTANYRGNQQGHDSYLRSDSRTPSSSGFGVSSYGTTSGFSTGYQSQNQFGSQYQSQPVSTNAFHTANYKGNQPGHDAQLRSDSWNTAQQSTGAWGKSGYSTGAGQSIGIGTSTFGTGSSFQASSQPFGTTSAQYGFGTSATRF